MPLEPDPVPGPVEERLAVALRLDRRARGGIDRLAGVPGRTARVAGRLGAVQDREQVPESLVGPLRRVAAGDPQRPRDVRAVAAERAADVEHDRLAGPDHPVGRLVVRRRRVGAGADDREVGLVVALGDEPLADLPRDVGLGPADQPPGRDLGDDPIGGLGGQPQQRDLVGVLDHPQVAQDGRRQGVLDRGPEGRLEPEQVHRQQRVGHADATGDAGLAAASAYGSSVSSQVTIRSGVRSPASAAPRSSRGTTTNGAWPARSDEHRQPLERHRLVAGQVAQVRADPDEQRVEPGRGGRGGRAPQPLGDSARAGMIGRVGDGHADRAPGGPARRRWSPARPRTACGRRAPARRRRRGPLAELVVVVLADREHAGARGRGRLDRGHAVVGQGGQVDDRRVDVRERLLEPLRATRPERAPRRPPRRREPGGPPR